jgi:hypothetical protein
MANPQFELEQLAISMQEAATALRALDTRRAAEAFDKVAERLRWIARGITASDRPSSDDTSTRNLPPQD